MFKYHITETFRSESYCVYETNGWIEATKRLKELKKSNTICRYNLYRTSDKTGKWIKIK